MTALIYEPLVSPFKSDLMFSRDKAKISRKFRDIFLLEERKEFVKREKSGETWLYIQVLLRAKSDLPLFLKSVFLLLWTL